MNFVHAALFFGLFMNFFVQNYVKKQVSRRKSPVLVLPKESKRQHLNHTTGVISPDNENNNVKHLCRTQMEKEQAVSGVEELQACATETCCHLGCKDSRNGIKNGRHYNYCIPQTMNVFQRVNGFTVPESLKYQKLKNL